LSDLLLHQLIQCPYCWEQIGIDLDLSVDGQSYIEDCQVCCQPIQISYSSSDGALLDVHVEQDNA
jgi:hypothetical protein